jgi:AbrB family looped-hinge helix DNA binding protein
MRTKVTKRGQVSVPAKVRQILEIRENTQLEWVIDGSTARVIPIPADPIAAFRGSSRKDLVKSLLNERKKDHKRENG